MGDAKKIVIPGGTGHIGTILRRALTAQGHEVVVLGRSGGVPWDGRTLGPWAREIDGCDAVINLAGRSVSCRYTKTNLTAMMASRVDSTRVVGEAIAQAARPPSVWLQMSTATIYAHSLVRAMDESAPLGGSEPDVPAYWRFSVDIATAWERAVFDAPTPGVRRVALRTAMVMAPDRGGAFNHLSRIARLGVGGPVAGGRQYMSWIHDADLVRATTFLLERDDISGPVNLAAPHPLPHRDFMRSLRSAWGVPIGIPATRWMTALGAFVIGTDTELLLKSRRVVPGRLLAAGFTFSYDTWPAAVVDLVRRSRN